MNTAPHITHRWDCQDCGHCAVECDYEWTDENGEPTDNLAAAVGDSPICSECGSRDLERIEVIEQRAVELTDEECDARLREIRSRDVYGVRTETPTPEQVAARDALFSILDCDDVGPQTAEPTYQEGALFRRQAS